VIAVDQDPLGQMATLVRRGPATDVLFKRLASGNYALAVRNRGDAPARIELRPADLGFRANSVCRIDVRDLWTGTEQHGASSLTVEIAPHDAAIWSVRSGRACANASRTGTITIITPGRHRQAIENYTHCLAGSQVKACTEDPAEAWTITSAGSLKSSQGCLGVADGKPVTQPCSKEQNPTLALYVIGRTGERQQPVPEEQRSERGGTNSERSALWAQPAGPDMVLAQLSNQSTGGK
jgi:Alpha galactosidase C-terminal beta sandwich domain